MERAGQWSVVWVGLTLIAASCVLSLGTGWWRRRRPPVAHQRRRTFLARIHLERPYLEWLPLMVGAVVVAGSLPRILGASAPTLSLTDTLAHVLALGTVFLFVRAVVILLDRGVRLVFRAVRSGSHG